MTEDKMQSGLAQIEKLIVDGNKGLLEKIGSVESALRQEIRSVDKKVDNLDKKVDNLDKKVDSLDKKVDLHYKMLDYDIKVVDKKVGEVKEKLDEHARIPHPA